MRREWLDKRSDLEKEAYEGGTGGLKEEWGIIFLCRMHKE